ncbi:MAG: arginine--tRNA ligase, partial [Anaerolineae bacterium]
MRIEHEIAAVVRRAIENAQAAGALPVFVVPEVTIERPRELSFGDYATPMAMKLARLARMAPLKIAQAIVDHLDLPDFMSEAAVAPPGFINFRLATNWLQQQVEVILMEGMEYGRSHIGDGKKVQIECVSANPTGPIHIGRTRGGVMGDTLARVMRAVGYDVTLEYYYNDAGRQITLLGETTKIRYQQLLGQDVELSDEHYQGSYITDIAQELVDKFGDSLLDEPVEYFGDYAKGIIAQSQKDTLKRINIVFDVYYNEQSLYETGRVWEALETLQERGYVYEKDNAQWFKPTEFGDDKDRVLVKQSGEPTYRMP